MEFTKSIKRESVCRLIVNGIHIEQLLLLVAWIRRRGRGDVRLDNMKAFGRIEADTAGLLRRSIRIPILANHKSDRSVFVPWQTAHDSVNCIDQLVRLGVVNFDVTRRR